MRNWWASARAIPSTPFIKTNKAVQCYATQATRNTSGVPYSIQDHNLHPNRHQPNTLWSSKAFRPQLTQTSKLRVREPDGNKRHHITATLSRIKLIALYANKTTSHRAQTIQRRDASERLFSSLPHQLLLILLSMLFR